MTVEDSGRKSSEILGGLRMKTVRQFVSIVMDEDKKNVSSRFSRFVRWLKSDYIEADWKPPLVGASLYITCIQTEPMLGWYNKKHM